MENRIHSRSRPFLWFFHVLGFATIIFGFLLVIVGAQNNLGWWGIAFSLFVIILGWWFIAMTSIPRPLKDHLWLGIGFAFIGASTTILLSPIIVILDPRQDVRYFWFGIGGMAMIVALASFLMGLAGRCGNKIEERWFSKK